VGDEVRITIDGFILTQTSHPNPRIAANLILLQNVTIQVTITRKENQKNAEKTEEPFFFKHTFEWSLLHKWGDRLQSNKREVKDMTKVLDCAELERRLDPFLKMDSGRVAKAHVCAEIAKNVQLPFSDDVIDWMRRHNVHITEKCTPWCDRCCLGSELGKLQWSPAICQ